MANSLPVLTEAEEAKLLVAYLRIHNYKFHHSPNETWGSQNQQARLRGIRMKREGASSGFPDYLIIVGGHLLFIELKRTKGSATSVEQKAWIEALNEVHNVQAFVARGAAAAIEIIEKYAKPLKLDAGQKKDTLGDIF